MTDRQRERRSAIVDLMQRPDQERVIRAHHWTCEGDERRYELVGEFARVFIQQSKVAREDGEEHAS